MEYRYNISSKYLRKDKIFQLLLLEIFILIKARVFIFRFTNPSDPIFCKMKKNKTDFFNVIFVFPSDSCQYIGVHFFFRFVLQPG